MTDECQLHLRIPRDFHSLSANRTEHLFGLTRPAPYLDPVSRVTGSCFIGAEARQLATGAHIAVRIGPGDL